MGLLDDLDQLIGSQKQETVLTSQNTTHKSKGRSEHSGKAIQQHANKEKTGAYSAWTLAQLQDEARKYGFRPSNDRKALLKQLKEVQEALNRQKEEQQDDDASAMGDTSIVSSSSFVCPSSSMDEEVSMSDLTMEMIRQARDEKSVVPGESSRSDGEVSENDDEEEEDNDKEGDAEAARLQVSTSSPTAITHSLSTQLHKAITSDKALYHRILLFEPVSFDEVSSTAKRAGVTGLKNKETLRNWLDMQGICFYSAELSGSRHRY